MAESPRHARAARRAARVCRWPRVVPGGLSRSLRARDANGHRSPPAQVGGLPTLSCLPSPYSSNDAHDVNADAPDYRLADVGRCAAERDAQCTHHTLAVPAVGARFGGVDAFVAMDSTWCSIE